MKRNARSFEFSREKNGKHILKYDDDENPLKSSRNSS
jgi:hypothetical protein